MIISLYVGALERLSVLVAAAVLVPVVYYEGAEPEV